mmetsp:Transcript_16762/g.31758  ORF Transcript_16762/g.31758 Transcript_16762/m.31758 type:complete len:445 (-) Transcript_16762:92-1426(-)
MSSAISARYPLQVIRTTAASISLFGSLILATMIISSPGKLRTPYRRIIFGLAMSDIIQSLGIIFSPLSQPKDTPGATWARGNIATCEAAGFGMTMGTVMLPMYTFLLTLYFLLIVKYKMTIHSFAIKVEWIFHFITLSWNIVGNSIQVAKDNFNANFNGLCNLTGYPMNCLIDPEIFGQCIRGVDAVQDAIILVQGPILVCFVGILACLGNLTYYVYILERRILQTSPSGQGMNWIRQSCMGVRNIFCPPTPTRPRHHPSHSLSHRSNGNDSETDSDVDALAQTASSSLNTLERQYSLARKSLVQSTLYVLSYLASYLFLTIALFLQFIPKAGTPLWMVYLLSITWPLSGVFNIFVYTRPKVRLLKDRYPTIPRFILFLLVVVSGGEAPPDSQIRAAMRSLGIVDNVNLSVSNPTHDDVDTSEPSPVVAASTTKSQLNKGFSRV